MDKVLNKMLVLLNNAIGFMYEQGMTETEIADYLITNVDMLKAIFPNANIYQSGGYTHCLFKSGVSLEDGTSDWWNAPYERS